MKTAGLLLLSLLLVTGCSSAARQRAGDAMQGAGQGLRDAPEPNMRASQQRLETTCLKQGVYVHCN